MTSPHLPPQTCSVSFHRKLKLIPLVLLVVFVGALSGIAAALSTIAWLVPASSVRESVLVRNSSVTAAGVEANVARLASSRVFTIYDTRQILPGKYYGANSELGSGVWLSADGWGVAPYSEALLLANNHLEAVSETDNHLVFEKMVADKVASVIYFKFKAADLPVVSFGKSVPAAELFYLTGSATSPLVNSPLVISPSVIIDKQGNWQGFMSDKKIISPDLVALQLPRILANEQTLYTTLPFSGIIINEVLITQTGERLPGLYISQLENSATKAGIKKGDLVVRLNGASIEVENFAHQNLLLDSPVRLTILRDKTIVEIEVEKVNYVRNTKTTK